MSHTTILCRRHRFQETGNTRDRPRPYRGSVLTKLRCAARLYWMTARLSWHARDCRQVLITGESRFCLSHGDGRVRVWHRRGEHHADVCVAEQDCSGGGSVMVWGEIHSRERTALVVLNGTLNAKRYVDEVIQPDVLSYVHGHRLTFQQDNAHPHAARLTQEFLRANAVHKLTWPVYSPKLSPVEHLWDLIIRHIRSRDPPPQTVPQLHLSIQEMWDDNLRQGSHIWSLPCHGDAEQCMRHEVVTPVIDLNAFKGPLHRGHWHNKLLYGK